MSWKWLLVVGSTSSKSGRGLLSLCKGLSGSLNLLELLFAFSSCMVKFPLELSLELLSRGLAALSLLFATLLNFGDVLSELIAAFFLGSLTLLFCLGNLALSLFGLLHRLQVQGPLALHSGSPTLFSHSWGGCTVPVQQGLLPSIFSTLELLRNALQSEKMLSARVSLQTLLDLRLGCCSISTANVDEERHCA